MLASPVPASRALWITGLLRARDERCVSRRASALSHQSWRGLVAPRKLSEHDVKKLRSRSPISGVPVLLYHRLSKSRTRTLDSRKARYEIPFSDFRSHLERIRQGGYRILSVPEVRDESLRSSKGPAVGITFDDGFASDYEEAFPALLAEGARADFFVNTANVGTSEYLNWSQIREMHRGGMGIHSHGHSHAALSLLSVDSLRREL